MSTRNQPIRVGAEPRAWLLPPEVSVRQAGRRLRARSNVAVVLVLGLVLIVNALAAVSVVTEQRSLETAQNRSIALLEQQSQFGKLRNVRSGIEIAHAAQRVGASPEILWREYLDAVEQISASDGVAITGITASSASPLEPFPQASTPFASPRVATLTLTAHSATLAAAKAWLESLSTLNGFVGASLTDVNRTDGGYEFTCILDVGPEAQSGRFAAEPTAEATPDPGASSSEAAEKGRD